MDEDAAGVWYVDGDPHAENGIFAQLSTIEDGKNYPACMVPAVLLAVAVVLIAMVIGT